MSTNDFEKKVRQKMDELNFVPSGTVWKEIEVKIRKRKERRRLLIWLPLLGLLLGSGIWAYKHYDAPGNDVALQQQAAPTPASAVENTDNNKELKKEPAEKNIHATTKTPVTAVPNNTASQPGKETATNKNEKTVKPVVATQQVAANDRVVAAPDAKDNNRSNKLVQQSNTQQRPVAYQPKQPRARKNIPVNNDVVSNNAGNKRVKNSQQKDKSDQVVAKNDAPPVKANDGKEKTLAEKLNTTVHSLDITKVTDDKEKVDVAANDKPATDSAAIEAPVTTANETLKVDSSAVAQAQKPVVVKKKTKIQWGFTGSIGISGVSNTLFSQEKALYSSSPAFSNNITSAPGNAGVPVFSGPSAVTPGTSFSLGVQARKSIGATYSMLAGVQYSYYSTRTHVGNKVDRLASVAQNTAFDRNVSTYYTSITTATQPYVNSYHFIEVPVTIEKQLGVKSRFAVNAGASLGFFAGSNALHYDQQRTIYYKDNTLFNKTQVNLLAGLSWRMLQRKRYSVAIAPGFRYGATNFFNKEIYGSKHLFSGSVGIQVFFGKK